MNVCFSFCAVLRANLILFLATKINLKGQFTQKCIFFPPPFTHPHAVPNPYEFLVEHKRR